MRQKGFAHIFVLILVVLGIGVLGYFVYKNGLINTISTTIKYPKAYITCKKQKGEWLFKYNECESMSSEWGINESQCEQLGGQFNSCRSACRHDPDYPKTFCISACIQVCKF